MSPSPSLRFGPDGRFELQAAERRLLVDGAPAALGSRALDLLFVLAARPGALLTKAELLDRVWPGLVVEEANLQVQISNLRKVLGAELIATVPGRGYRFTAALQETAAARAEPPRAPPPGPRLVGRDADLARLEALLEDGGGCVSLVGPAGVGKTSLARAAVARRAGRSAWVELAPLPEGSAVIGAAARALGLQLADDDPTPLLKTLRDEALLLVLDNAEHVVPGCVALATLLQPLAGVRLLVTSQLPLAIGGERVQRLEPLGGPAADDAVTLLVERIVAADHRFRVTPDTQPLLKALCAQLDGLPLALEMAAARVPLLGLHGVHDALAQRFALLTRGRRDAPARHRTLHDALDWSYHLLSEGEQRLFRSLGVFAGGFTLELAIAHATDDDAGRWDVIDHLAALVDRSLIGADGADPPRYRLLETMRAYALERLAAAGEETAARQRHADVLRALFERHVPGTSTLLPLCLAEMENAREAIAWTRRHDVARAVQLAPLMMSVTIFSLWRQESGDWLLALEDDLQRPAVQALPPRALALWWTEAARALGIRKHARAPAAARTACALWKPLGEPHRSLFAAVVWVRSLLEPGPELDEACAELRALADAIPDPTPRERLLVHGSLVQAAATRRDYEAVLEGRLAEMVLAGRFGMREMADAAETNVVNALNILGRHPEAAARAQAMLARLDADPAGAANGNLPWLLRGLLEALLQLERLDEAQALAARAWAADGRFGVNVSIAPIALLVALRERHAAAARIVGHLHRRHADAGTTIDWDDAALVERALALANAALGAAAVDTLVEQGRTLADEAAAALAVGDAAAP